jgi:hypothetical protein
MLSGSQKQIARYLAHAFLYTVMTYSKATPVGSTEDAVGLNSYAMSWFVPPLVVPALLAALFLAWIAYQAYS